MKIQLSTAIALRDELDAKLAATDTGADEIEVSPTAAALIHDVVARDELQSEIDGAQQ
jgi:hypothetical protein